jgi:ADP-ribosylglycohydrolase
MARRVARHIECCAVNTDLLKHIRGGVYGQAFGDAFCMPALLSPDQTRARFPVIPDTLVAPDGSHIVHHGLPAGRVTDDTEQAVYLAREVLAAGAVTHAAVARAVIGWYDAVGGDTLPFAGPSTRRAVARIRAGEDPAKTGLGGDTNGAAMRVSVLGFLFPGDVEAAARAGAQSAVPTHNTRAGCASAAAVAAAVAAALSPNATLRDVLNAGLRGAEVGHEIGVQHLGASVARRIEFAVSLARDNEGDDSRRLQAIYDLVGTSLAASESVPAAFGVLALADGDPLRAARLAFELSGDADTVAAIACAIAGAFKGVDAIPAAMRATLDGANPNFDFEALARDLHAAALARRVRAYA